MRRIGFSLGFILLSMLALLSLLSLLALWLASMPFGDVPVDVFALRPPFLQSTGTLAIGLMSVAMVLATPR